MATSAYDLPETSATDQGSLESALAGDYDFSIGELLGEAWRRTDGVKMPINIGLSIYFVVYLFAALLVPFALSGFTLTMEPAAQLTGTLLNMLIGYPLMAGVMMMGVFHAAGRPVTVAMTWQYLPKMLPIFFLMLVMMLLVMLGFVLLVLPGIYLSIAYMFAMLLVIDHGMGVWEALETSRKAVTAHWFKVFGVMLVMGLVIFVSMLPLGIGLIWTIPMCYVLMGLLYQRIFGLA